MLESKKRANKEWNDKNLTSLNIAVQKPIAKYIKNFAENNSKYTKSRYCLLAILYCIDNNIMLQDIDIKEYLATHCIDENENSKSD